MVTGLFGPQTDPDIYPNWGRGHQTTGEDPYLSQQMVVAQINGVQGQHTMAQMKHFAGYNAQNQNAETDVQDQALHEILLTPYEGGFTDGKAAAGMCSYQLLKDTSPYLPGPESSLMSPGSPFAAGSSPTTWPLNEAHFACEQPLLAHIMRDQWGSVAMIGSDYPAIHSTTGLFQGLADQEMPTANGFYNGGNGGTDPTGSTCADATGTWEPCTTAGAVHVGGVPNNFQNSGMTGCPANGCTLNQAVASGGVPLSLFKQSLARILYQEERFGMLGCDDTPVASTCTNPGGIGSDRTGNAPIPAGPASGATPSTDLGTEAGDAAVSEKGAEEGSVLLKNDGGALPIKGTDLAGGIAVVRPERRVPRRRAEPRGLDRLPGPHRHQPAAAAAVAERQRGRVLVQPGQRPDRRAGPVVGAVDLVELDDRQPQPDQPDGGHRAVAGLHHQVDGRPARAGQLLLDGLRVRARAGQLHVPPPAVGGGPERQRDVLARRHAGRGGTQHDAQRRLGGR